MIPLSFPFKKHFMEIKKIDRERIVYKVPTAMLDSYADLGYEWIALRIVGALSEALLRHDAKSFCAQAPDPLSMDCVDDTYFKETYLENVFGTFEESIAEAAYYLVILQATYGSKLENTPDAQIEAVRTLITGLSSYSKPRDLETLRREISEVLYKTVFVLVSGMKIVDTDMTICSAISRLEAIASMMEFDIQHFCEWYNRFKELDIDYGNAE